MGFDRGRRVAALAVLELDEPTSCTAALLADGAGTPERL